MNEQAGKRLSKEQLDVYVRTETCDIQGTIHFFAGARITEHLNRPDVRFVPMTAVTVRNTDGSVQNYPFLSLNKEQILFLAPKE